MKSIELGTGKRFFAALLAVVMIFSLLPMQTIAFAENPTASDAVVTIHVNPDVTGAAAGAVVSYTVGGSSATATLNDSGEATVTVPAASFTYDEGTSSFNSVTVEATGITKTGWTVTPDSLPVSVSVTSGETDREIVFGAGFVQQTTDRQTVTPGALTYNGSAQDLLTGVTLPDGYTCRYQVTETTVANASELDAEAWSAVKPTGTDAGTYRVWIEQTETGKLPAEAAYVDVTIAKADPELYFKNYTAGTTLCFVQDTVDMTANATTGLPVSYIVSDSSVGTISDSGELTLNAAGFVTVTATVNGDAAAAGYNANYNSKSVSFEVHAVAVKTDDVHMNQFKSDCPAEVTLNVNGTLGTFTAEAISAYANDGATPVYKTNEPAYTYSLAGTYKDYFKIDSATGVLTVKTGITDTEIKTLIDAMEAAGGLTVDVTASTAETLQAAADTVTKTVKVVFAAAASVYSIDPSCTPNAAGWYNSNVTLNAAAGYTLFNGTSFAATAEYSTEAAQGVLYAKSASGDIIKVQPEIKLDKTAPTMTVFSIFTDAAHTVASTLLFGKSTTVYAVVEADDSLSGVKSFTWTALFDAGQTGTETAALKSGTTYSANITLTVDVTSLADGKDAQNKISVTATDNADNTGTAMTSAEIEVDNTAPVISDITINGAVKDEATSKYYAKADSTVTLTFVVTEKNFASDKVTVKAGTETYTIASWTDDGDKHTATVNLDAAAMTEGEYVFTIDATDKAANAAVQGTSSTLVIDRTAPTLAVSYDTPAAADTDKKRVYYGTSEVGMTVTVTETNFDASKAVVTIDGTAAAASDITWSGSAGTLKISGEGDHHVVVNCTDLAGNAATTYTEPNTIVIDTTKPVVSELTYDIAPTTIEGVDYILKQTVITVTVTDANFNADTAKSTVVCTPTEYASGVAYTCTIADSWTQDSTDAAKWTRTVTLAPNAKFDLSVKVVDMSGNAADELTHHYETDDQAPKISSIAAAYSQKDGITGVITKLWQSFKEILGINAGYYNTGIDLTFTAMDIGTGVKEFRWSYIKEDNVTAKDSLEPQSITGTANIIKSDAANADGSYTYTAKVSLPLNEGDQYRGYLKLYAVDYAGNEVNYPSDSAAKGAPITAYYQEGETEKSAQITEVILDTMAPIITVTYNQTPSASGTSSRTGKATEFFKDSTVTGTISITEANFYNGEDVTINVNGADGGSAVLDSAWTQSGDTWTKNFTFTGDGDYSLEVSYPQDRSGNASVLTGTYNTVSDAGHYVSEQITIDTKAPTYTVTYTDGLVNPNHWLSNRNPNTFYKSGETAEAVITITEHNFNLSDIAPAADVVKITACDVAGTEVKDAYTITSSDTAADAHVRTSDKQTYTVTFNADANYTLDLAYTDQAGNAMTAPDTKYLTKDTVLPTLKLTAVTPSKTLFNGIGFYQNDGLTVQVDATDVTSGIESVEWSYAVEPNVSSVNAKTDSGVLSLNDFTQNGTVFTGKFTLPASKQYRGYISLTAVDQSGNTTGEPVVYKISSDTIEEVVVDTISPTMTISYNTPVSEANNISYYAGTITGTLTVNEANFYASDVVVRVNGADVKVTWNTEALSTDTHVGTFTIDGDGDYTVTVSYTDKSTNTMTPYTSNQLTIDTQITAPQVTINGSNPDGVSYPAEAVLAITLSDTNYRDYTAKLTRTVKGSKGVDVTNTFLTTIGTDKTGGTAQFDTFDMVQANDGIYTLTVTMNDYAGHTATTTVTFTLNRFGSVYSYDNYLSDLIADGGKYVQEVDKDLVITEYNADRLVEDSVVVTITRDGRPISDVKYTVTPEVNDRAATGTSGWYEYSYTISKDNFTEDGIYTVSITSVDTAGNTPENTSYEDMGIVFTVDHTPPELSKVSGLEERIINAESQEVDYTVYENIALASVVVYIDDVKTEEVTEFDDVNNFSDLFTIAESNNAQTVRIVMTDLAGNVTDTSSEEFNTAEAVAERSYVMNETVIVSTNGFVRFYANKPLFFGTIAGVAVIAVALGVGIPKAAAKKKKEA